MLDKGVFNCEETLMQGAEIPALYEEASKKNPKDEEFSRYWFQQMVLRNNIDGARKVLLRLDKN